jgi:hypothetical protein
VHLTAQLAIRCLIANYCMRWHCNFKGLSQDGGQSDSSKNLRASLFNDNPSNEPNLGRIHLAAWTVPLNYYTYSMYALGFKMFFQNPVDNIVSCSGLFKNLTSCWCSQKYTDLMLYNHFFNVGKIKL